MEHVLGNDHGDIAWDPDFIDVDSFRRRHAWLATWSCWSQAHGLPDYSIQISYITQGVAVNGAIGRWKNLMLSNCLLQSFVLSWIGCEIVQCMGEGTAESVATK